jgi:Zn-dependent protease with chaperone function
MINLISKKSLALLLFFLLQFSMQANILKKLKLRNPLSAPRYHLPFEIKICEKESSETRDQKLYEYTNILSNKLQIKAPEIFIFYAKKSKLEYNAFATYLKTGKPIVAFGNLLTKRWQDAWFTDEEIEAILAHELCHIKHHHMLKAGLLSLILTGPLLISNIVPPTPSPKELVKHAYSRKQEREADLMAIEVLDDPLNLLSALIKLQCLNTKKPKTKESFDYEYEVTKNELIKEKDSFIFPLIELLSTHPLTSKRISYIKKQAENKYF